MDSIWHILQTNKGCGAFWHGKFCFTKGSYFLTTHHNNKRKQRIPHPCMSDIQLAMSTLLTILGLSSKCSILTHLPLDKMAPILAGDIFKCVFLNENIWISIKISLKFVPKVRINNNPALVQIIAWRRIGDKPLSEPMLARFTDAYMRVKVQQKGSNIKSLLLIWRSGTRRFYLRVPDLQMSCKHITAQQGTRTIATVLYVGRHATFTSSSE